MSKVPFGIKRSPEEVDSMEYIAETMDEVGLTPAFLVSVRSLVNDLLDIHATGGFRRVHPVSENIVEMFENFATSLTMVDVPEAVELRVEQSWPVIKQQIVKESDRAAEIESIVDGVIENLGPMLANLKAA